MLICVNKIVDEKWGISPKNQRLLVIVAKFLTNSSKIDSEIVEKVCTYIFNLLFKYTIDPNCNS